MHISLTSARSLQLSPGCLSETFLSYCATTMQLVFLSSSTAKLQLLPLLLGLVTKSINATSSSANQTPKLPIIKTWFQYVKKLEFLVKSVSISSRIWSLLENIASRNYQINWQRGEALTSLFSARMNIAVISQIILVWSNRVLTVMTNHYNSQWFTN